MGCTPSKVQRYEAPRDSQRNQSNSSLHGTPKSTSCSPVKSRHTENSFSLFGQVNEFFENQRLSSFDLSDASQIESFMTKICVKIGSQYQKEAKIQLNPAAADQFFLEPLEPQQVEDILQRPCEMPTVVYNPCVQQKGFCLQPKELESFAAALEQHFHSLFDQDESSLLIIEILPPTQFWQEDQGQIMIKICHQRKKQDVTSTQKFLAYRSSDQKAQSSCSSSAAIENDELIFKKLYMEQNLAIDSEKRILLLDDNLINLKILLAAFLNRTHSILTTEEKAVLKDALGASFKKELERAWNGLTYLELSSRMKIYLCQTPNQARMISYHAQPNYIISDQDLGRKDSEILLGSDFLKSLPFQKRFDGWKPKTMLYTASANEPHVLATLETLPQKPALISKGDSNLPLHLKTFLTEMEFSSV